MFDIGFTELLVIGIVALIVVGPKDLPMMFRTLGRFTARARALGREFTSAMNAAADESGIKEAANELKGMTSPSSYGVNKLKEAADAFDKWDPTKPAERQDEAAKAKPVDPERAADIEKIRAATEKAGRAKLEREAAEKAAAEAGETAPATAPKPAPAKKPAAKKPAAKTAASKPAAKKAPAKKPAAKTPAKSDKADNA